MKKRKGPDGSGLSGNQIGNESDLSWELSSSVDDSEDVLLGQQHVFITTELDVGSGVLAVEHLVADTDLGSLAASVVIALARSDLNHFTHLGLFLGGVREKDATGSGLFRCGHLDEDAISERLDGGDAERNSSHGC